MSKSDLEKWPSRYVIQRSLSLLPKIDRIKILAVAIIQITLSFLDLLGVAVIGVIGAIAVNGIAAKTPGNRASTFLNFLGLENASLQRQVGTLALIAVVTLIGKTLITMSLSRRVLFYLSRVSARMSANLVARLLSSPLVTLQQRTVQEQMFAVTSGVSTITVGIIGIAVSLLSDISLMIILTAGLFVVEPIMAILNLFCFSIVALLLHRGMHLRALRLGDKQSVISIRSNQRIFEILNSYREAFVKNRRGYYAKTIGDDRMKLAETSSELGFMPQISKYVIESTVVVVAVIICGVQFLISDATRAVGVLAVFMAASLRIAPAVLRIQQSLVSVRSSIGSARPTLELIESFGTTSISLDFESVPSRVYEGFESRVEVENALFSYPTGMGDVIKDISFEIEEGEIVAIVGPSGSGKTTLVDLILGILQPRSGSVKISGLESVDAIRKWSGAISYVPQDVMVMNGTIKENVCMGFDTQQIPDELVWQSLDIAQLSDFVQSMPDKLESQVGDRGTKISGGQRQRLGIARALITKPKLLVLDEATSALDGETEANISAAIQSMRGNTTVVMIAHRLSTVRSADKVLYLSDGKLAALGSFEDVRREIPDFDRQAQLMGL